MHADATLPRGLPRASEEVPPAHLERDSFGLQARSWLDRLRSQSDCGLVNSAAETMRVGHPYFVVSTGCAKSPTLKLSGPSVITQCVSVSQ